MLPFPPDSHPPLSGIRVLDAARVLAGPLQPGVRMNAAAERALWDDAMPFERGLSMLREQLDRLERATDGPRQRHPIFGPLTAEEWMRFHLRHAALHLTCPVRAESPHLYVFHTGGVVLAAALGFLASRLPPLVGWGAREEPTST